jgi:hypothetical protein
MNTDLTEYLSFSYGEYDPETPYEIRLSPSLRSFNFITDKDFSKWMELIREELYLRFLFFLNDNDLRNVFEFLNFQFLKYKESNQDSQLFLLFIQEVITEGSELGEARDKTILYWIEKKRNEIFQESEKGQGAEVLTHKEFKTPPLNESTKPKLTQAQTVMLFKLMKEEHIISNKNLSKKDYSKLIHYLTGYSENTLRQDFSSVQLIELSDSPQDYDQIIDTLNSLINKLNKGKSQIS